MLAQSWSNSDPLSLRMMTSSNINIFPFTGHLLGEFTGHRWFPSQRPVTRSFGVFFYLRLNKRLSKQSWGWWFETPSRSLWRHCWNSKVGHKALSPILRSLITWRPKDRSIGAFFSFWPERDCKKDYNKIFNWFHTDKKLHAPLPCCGWWKY